MGINASTSRVTESLDSLWFFSNVLSSTTTRQVLFEPPIEEFSKPISENPSVVVVLDVVGAETSSAEREETMVRERGNGRRRRQRKIRKSFGEIDLGFDDDVAKETKVSESHELTAAWWFERNCGYCLKMGCLYHHYKNMPPLHDNIAMKQHLKSWAYAVACTVK